VKRVLIQMVGWTKTECELRSSLGFLGRIALLSVIACLCILFFNATDTPVVEAQSAVPQVSTVARDRSAESIVAKSLSVLLADQHITGLTRYDPPLLSEGVCSSIKKNSWVTLMKADEGLQAFYQTNDPSQPSNELRALAIDTAHKYKPMSRFAVAVWKEKLASGSSQYWVAVVLAKSAASDWFGSHLGADTPREMVSPNYAAVEAVVPECRHK
jgi:hypothetical protein